MMRVSTAAVYTLTALVTQDLFALAIAAAPSLPARSVASGDVAVSPDSPVNNDGVPVSPAETLPPEWVKPEESVVAPVAHPKSEAPAATIAPPKGRSAPAATASTSPKAVPPTATASQPSAHPTTNPANNPAHSATTPPNVPSAANATTLPSAATPPPTLHISTRPLPESLPTLERSTVAESSVFNQTVNQEQLAEWMAASGQTNLSTMPSVSIRRLSLAEVKTFQREATGGDRPKDVTTATKPNAATPTTNATTPLVSPTLVEDAATALNNPATSNQPTPAPADHFSMSANLGNSGSGSLSVYDFSSTSARDFYNLTLRPPALLGNGNLNLLFPLSIPAAITSAFGWREHPVLGGARFHSGTDIGAPQGTPVLAAFDGKVEIADFVGGYGLTVVLRHNQNKEETLYGHLSEVFVQPGDEVKQGEVVGRVGSTGLSTGPHLHFEFRRQTQEGWVVMDAGPALEHALLNFGQGPRLAQAHSKWALLAVFKYPGKFLREVQVASPAQPSQAKPSQAQAQLPPANPSQRNRES